MTVIHKNYEYDKLKTVFYDRIKEFCNEKKIVLKKVNSLTEIRQEITECRIGICVGFMSIIKKEIFSIPESGILNLHCGKLPDYRGRAPISRAIMNSDKNIYITVHRIDEGIDSGDILSEKAIPIEDEDDVNSLYEKCSKKSGDIMIESIQKIKSGNAIFRKQDLSRKQEANKKITDEERKINWNDSAIKIRNLIRALHPPYPGAYCFLGGDKYIFAYSLIDRKNETEYRNGEAIDIKKDKILINCRDATLSVSKIYDIDLIEINLQNKFKKGDIFE